MHAPRIRTAQAADNGRISSSSGVNEPAKAATLAWIQQWLGVGVYSPRYRALNSGTTSRYRSLRRVVRAWSAGSAKTRPNRARRSSLGSFFARHLFRGSSFRDAFAYARISIAAAVKKPRKQRSNIPIGNLASSYLRPYRSFRALAAYSTAGISSLSASEYRVGYRRQFMRRLASSRAADEKERIGPPPGQSVSMAL